MAWMGAESKDWFYILRFQFAICKAEAKTKTKTIVIYYNILYFLAILPMFYNVSLRVKIHLSINRKMRKKGIDRCMGCCHGQAGTAFHAHPVLVGQDGSGGKQVVEDWFSRVVEGPETIVDLQSCPVD